MGGAGVRAGGARGGRVGGLPGLIDPAAMTERRVVVVGAGTEKGGPGPLVSALAGRRIADLRIPITIVPGSMTKEEIIAAS